MTCNIGELANGEVDTVKIGARAIATGTATSKATVSAAEDDPITDNNQYTETTRIDWGYINAPGKGYDPVIAVDAAGVAHICYLSEDNDLIYTTNKTRRWVTDTLTSSQKAGSHGIATDTQGHVHIAYAEGEGAQKKIMYVNDTSGTWSAPVALIDHAGEGQYVNIKIDPENYIHISCVKSMFNGPVMYSTTKSPLGVLWENYLSCAMDIDTDGNAYFSYYAAPGGIMFRSNAPDWGISNPEVVDDNWGGAQMESLVTDIAVDTASNPHISYVGNQGSGAEDTRYAWYANGQWNDILIDDGGYSGSWNAIATDKDNNVHIIYYHHSITDQIRYATNSTGSWQKTGIEFDIGGDPYSTTCDIATDTVGYVHMTFMKKDKVYYITNRPPPPPLIEPDIYVNPRSIDFGRKHVGHISETKKVTIRNNGEDTLHISDISLIWSDSIHFLISNNTCGVLAPADTCSVNVAFLPRGRGDQRARIRITSDDPDEPEVLVSLRGIGVAPRIQHYGITAFGNVQIGDSAAHDYIIKKYRRCTADDPVG